MIVVDTSMLIDALTGARRSEAALRLGFQDGERMRLTALVLYEWLRGPRQPEELVAQATLFPRESAVAFGPAEAALAATLYKKVRSPRGREIDLAIAACAIVHDAGLWTLNPEDFRDVPELRLATPPNP